MQHQHRHLHARKRPNANLEPYPSKKVRIWFVDAGVYAASIMSPIFTIPQVWDIYIAHNAAGVSALTWGAYTLFTFPWLMYGIVHKERVLIYNNALWVGLNGVIFAGALLY